MQPCRTPRVHSFASNHHVNQMRISGVGMGRWLVMAGNSIVSFISAEFLRTGVATVPWLRRLFHAHVNCLNTRVLSYPTQ